MRKAKLCHLFALPIIVAPLLLLAAGESNSTVVMLRPGEYSFWHTATNHVMTVPVDMPPLATSGTLTVRGLKYERMYGIATSGDFEISLPPATSAQSENVYELTLSFNDGTVRTARIGLVRGYSSGAEATTSVLSPAGGAGWSRVKRRAVMPIPYGMTAFSVNGVEVDTGLGGDQGWYALMMASGEGAEVSMDAGGETFSADLLGLGDGCIMSFR